MACVQIIQSELKDQNNPKWQEVIDTYKNAEGVLSLFYGSQHENSKIRGLFINWKSLDAQNAWSTSDHSNKIKSLLDEMNSAPYKLDFVLLNSDPLPALRSPTLEVASWFYKTSKIDSSFEKKVVEGHKKWADVVSKESQSSGHIVSGWEENEFDHDGEKTKKYTALIGWDSVDGHLESKKGDKFQSVFPHIMDHGHHQLDMVHYTGLKEA